MTCPICLSPDAQVSNHPSKDARKVICVRCGTFLISGTAFEEAPSLSADARWRLSAWIRQNVPEMIVSDTLSNAAQIRVPGLLHRADRMLRALNDWHPRGQSFVTHHANYEKMVAIGWNTNSGEVRFILESVLVKELGYLEFVDSIALRLTARGFLHLEGTPNATSTVGFCAMWFGDEVQQLWTEVIQPAIGDAGYEPLKIDGKPHNGKIDDAIVASIRSARFVVADFTGHRGGVYYEAGFAHGLGVQVIFMCREDQLSDLHFDIRQYNCIVWKGSELENARTRLKNRILATLGEGPLKVQ